MHKHPFFKLYLYDSSALESFLQCEIIKRETLHEWPLSCVELLVLTSGQRWVYKSQFGPSVEAEFYGAVQSDLLPAARVLPCNEESHSHMLFEFIDAPLLSNMNLSPEEAFETSQVVLKRIKGIDRDIPYYLDISSEEKWIELVDVTLASLSHLISTKVFTSTNESRLTSLRSVALGDSVLSTLNEDVGLVHGDLKGENVFVLPDAFQIIDWQRPILGPRVLDLLTLRSSLGLEPERHVAKGSILLSNILQVNWFVECALKWFPEGHKTYDQSVDRLIQLMVT